MATRQPILNQRYRVEKRLGRGAMGEVFLATDMQENEPVAIKTINEDLYKDPEVQKRFSREVVAMRKLNHPNIISCVDAFTFNNRACLVMEYVSGGTLDELIQDRGPLDEGLFKKIALALVEGMATAHEAGILHRDLKPANILLSSTLEPKIADFGLARLTELSTMTSSGIAMGTLTYMSPEAFDPLTRGDHRSDIWTLGVIFFEMLTGTLPFLGKTQPQVINAILNDAPEPLARYRRDISPFWETMVQKCLQKHPYERYQNTRDMVMDLNEVPRALQNVSASSSKAGSFEFRFIEVSLDNEIAPKVEFTDLGRQRGTVADRALQPALPKSPPPKIEFRPQREQAPPLAAMMFGGAFIWLGILLSFGGALLTVVKFTTYGETIDISSGAAQGLLMVGSLLFIMGLIFEAFYLNRERWLELGILVLGTGAIWGIFFSEQLLKGFFVSLLGTMFYFVALLMYFQLQRT